MNIIIFGYSGLIGNRIYKYFLDKSYNIICFTRKKVIPSNPKTTLVKFSLSDIQEKIKKTLNKEEEYILFLLTGESIFSYINKNKWQKIYDSRITLNRKIIQTLENSNINIKKIFAASAIGIYYNNSLESVTEESPISSNILTEFIKEWESTILNSSYQSKAVIMRFGAVLDKNSKIYKSLIIPAIFSIGINFNPTSYFPWIHNQEIPNIIDFIIQKDLKGVFNIVNDNYITYKDFIKIFVEKNSILKKCLMINIPKKFLERILKNIMPEYYEVIYSLFNSPKVIPQKLLESGYQFKYTDILN